MFSILEYVHCSAFFSMFTDTMINVPCLFWTLLYCLAFLSMSTVIMTYVSHPPGPPSDIPIPPPVHPPPISRISFIYLSPSLVRRHRPDPSPSRTTLIPPQVVAFFSQHLFIRPPLPTIALTCPSIPLPRTILLHAPSRSKPLFDTTLSHPPSCLSHPYLCQ